jgi:two-component system OmpR family sensor kinase
MSIRWRLTLWFTLILGVIILLFGAFFFSALQNWLVARVDGNLKEYSAKVHATMPSGESTGPPDYDVIHSSLPPINEIESPGIFVQIVDSSDNVVVKSDNLGDQELPVGSSLIATGFSGR